MDQVLERSFSYFSYSLFYYYIITVPPRVTSLVTSVSTLSVGASINIWCCATGYPEPLMSIFGIPAFGSFRLVKGLYRGCARMLYTTSGAKPGSTLTATCRAILSQDVECMIHSHKYRIPPEVISTCQTALQGSDSAIKRLLVTGKFLKVNNKEECLRKERRKA